MTPFKRHPYRDWTIVLAALVLGFALAAWWFRGGSDANPSPKKAVPIKRWQGYVPNPQETERFLQSLPKPLLREQGPELFKDRRDHDTFLYRAWYDAYREYYGREWTVGAQGIGDCVSWGWAHGADCHLAVLWKIGESAEWKPAATEAIYGGSRVEARGVTFGGWSDGSYGAAAAKWVKNWGIVFRQRYDDLGIDLTTYSAARAKQWGAYGCGGRNDNGRLDNRAKSHPIKSVALVTDFDSAAKAIQSGYPVVVCSGQGFSSRRDSQGFCAPRGSWSHCMCFIGVRFGDRPGLLCLNSWGPRWVSGPKWPDDQPDGSFWVDARVATRMLSGRDSFAVSGYSGFPYRPLDHGDWVRVEPKRKPLDRRFKERRYALAQ